jgi:hypothetical protein
VAAPRIHRIASEMKSTLAGISGVGLGLGVGVEMGAPNAAGCWYRRRRRRRRRCCLCIHLCHATSRGRSIPAAAAFGPIGSDRCDPTRACCQCECGPVSLCDQPLGPLPEVLGLRGEHTLRRSKAKQRNATQRKATQSKAVAEAAISVAAVAEAEAAVAAAAAAAAVAALFTSPPRQNSL